MRGDNGREWGAMGDQGRQDLGNAGAPFKTGKQEGRWETMEDDKGRQDLGKADTPSNTNANCGETIGDKGRQDLGEGGHTIQHRHTCGETVGDNGRQGRGQRRQTYHHRRTRGETMGDKKGRQHVGKADPPSNIGKRVGRQCETMRSMGQKG